jgi:Papain family cysteine protease
VTAASTLEGALAIQYNKTANQTAVSVQHLVDCDLTNLGCWGGYSHTAFDFMDHFGFLYQSEYPQQYLGKRGMCSQ